MLLSGLSQARQLNPDIVLCDLIAIAEVNVKSCHRDILTEAQRGW